jgi:hypothetical protein
MKISAKPTTYMMPDVDDVADGMRDRRKLIK